MMVWGRRDSNGVRGDRSDGYWEEVRQDEEEDNTSCEYPSH